MYNIIRAARIAAIITASVLALTFTTGCSQEEKTPKYVFLFIGDGMGQTHVAAAESYLSYKEGKLGGEALTFTQFPVYGTCCTYSANSRVTCSAAAGTAIACGEKTNNGTIGLNAEGDTLKSVAYELQEKGYKVGIITSVPINHATPAAFYAHNESRNGYYSIGEEIYKSGFNFFAGAGFLDYFGSDGKNESIPDKIAENGYTVCFSEQELAENIGKDKIVFCQPSGKEGNAKNYSLEQDGQAKDIELSTMLEYCIKNLGTENRFFIMCEGGEIDWAAHANSTMETVKDIMKFDKAIAVAYDFYLQHPDETLILVTADHETGGITLGNADWELFEKEQAEPSGEYDNNSLNHKARVRWTTGSHTGGHVPVYAIGAGAEKFAGRQENTDLKDKILCK